MGRSLLIILGCLALLVSGCGSSSSGGATASEKADPSAAEESASSAKPKSAADEGEGASEATESPLWLSGPQPPIRHQAELKLEPSGLAGSEPKPFIPKAHPSDRVAVKELLDGIGTYAFTPARVTVQYVGYDYKTGKKFASSWEKGQPVTFTLGAGEVIPAWEEVLDGMEIGDRRVLVVPPKLAKGSYPPNIPQGKTVAFIVELLPDSSEAKAEQAFVANPVEEGKLKVPRGPLPKGPPPKKLAIKDIKPGSGPRAEPGDEIVFRYREVDYKTGKEFDSSLRQGRPYRLTLGSHQFFRAWENGLKGMRVGGRRQVIAPPAWAFEPWVSNVAPHTTLVFDVELLAIS